MDLTRRTALTVVLVLVFAATGRAADPMDTAELFPPNTLAYAELHNPAALGADLAAVVKGTVLEDAVAFIQTRRDAAKTPADVLGKRELAIVALLASPEMATEFKKLRGVGIGLTGFNEQGEPCGALAVLTGDSAAAGLAAKAYLTTGAMRKVGIVGDVPVYQSRQPTFIFDPNDGQQKLDDKPPVEGTYEATCAYVPGLFVIGTSREAVGEVVTRFRGSKKGSLAANPVFQEAATTHRHPGVFLFANVPAFCTKFEEVQRAGLGDPEPDAFGWFKLVANPKALRYLAGSVRFRDGGLALSVGGAFDPAGKSPLGEFLAGEGAKVELLHSAPAPATVALAITLPDKGRASAVIGVLDAIAKANGTLGRLPSDAIKEWEGKFKVPLAEGLIGKTRAITVVVPLQQNLPKGAVALPMLVLHTDSAAVATAWEELLPKVAGDLAGGPPLDVSTETVGGVLVRSIAGGGLPWKAALHSARKDGVFVVGLDRKLVAAAALGDSGRSVVAGTTTLGRSGEAPPLLGTLSLGGLLRRVTETSIPDGPVVPLTAATPSTGLRQPGEIETDSPKQKENEAKAWTSLLKALDGLPPAIATGQRIGNELRFEVWQPKVQGGGLGPVVIAGLGWYEMLLDRNADPNTPYYGRRRFR